MGRLVKGELFVSGISALQAPPSNFHLKAVQPQACAALVPQLKVPPGPTLRVTLFELTVPCGSPAMPMPCAWKPPKLTPPKPAPMAGEPGRSRAAARNWAGVTLVGAVPLSELRFRRGSTTRL